MAFMGRGDIPSIDIDIDDDNVSNSDYGRRYRAGWFHVYYYIPLDNTYVQMEMIAAIIIFIIVGISYLVSYKSSIVDPIEGVKKAFFNTSIVITLALMILVILANYFSKEKKVLIKRLATIAIVALVMILGVGIGKIYLDSKYNRNTFEKFYIQEYGNETDKKNKKERIDLSLSGFDVKSEKKYYIDECMKAYNIFTIRTYLVLLMDLLLIVLIIYQIYKVYRIQEKRDKLEKDDIVVYDEEENVKF